IFSAVMTVPPKRLELRVAKNIFCHLLKFLTHGTHLHLFFDTFIILCFFGRCKPYFLGIFRHIFPILPQKKGCGTIRKNRPGKEESLYGRKSPAGDFAEKTGGEPTACERWSAGPGSGGEPPDHRGGRGSAALRRGGDRRYPPGLCAPGTGGGR